MNYKEYLYYLLQLRWLKNLANFTKTFVVVV